MKKFSQLVEASKNTVVLSFGRFSPPTSGHEKLINKVIDTARKNNADHYIYASKTQDKKKNPLNIQQKLKYLKGSFPQVNIVGADNTVRTPIEAVKFLDSKYENIIFIAGSDRVSDFQKLFDTYNGKEYNYKSIKVVSAGERDPDADDVSGMSASKMRQMAIENNFDQFKTGVPTKMSPALAKQMFNDVRSGLNIKEGYTEDRREKYINEEIFRVGDIVEYEGNEYPISYRGSNYVLIETDDSSKRVWLTDILETDKVDLEMVHKSEDKLKIARIIGESFSCSIEKNDPVAIINSCLRKAKDMRLTEEQLDSLDNMLVIADECGINFDKELAGMVEDCGIDSKTLMTGEKDDENDHLRRRKINYKIHEDEDLDDAELDKILSELSDDDFIEDCYDDDEFELVDEDTGEPLEEDYDFSELNEVLSRVERIRARVRMRRTKSKRQRAVKIALKRRSNTQTLTRRARKMAIKTLKQRFSRKPINQLSVGEKERLEHRMKKMKSTVTRLATRMIPRVRSIEKARFDSRAAKQGQK